MEHTGSHKAGLSVRFATVFAALFLQYGFLLPFWPVYLKARGFDAQAIGLFYAVMGCARIATVPLAAFFGERYGQSPRYLTLLAVLAATPYAVFAVTDSFAIDLVLAAAIATFLPALMAILDAKTLAAAQTHGLSYGQARLWGSATFIAVNLGGGILITAFGRDHINWMLCGAALIGAASMVLVPAGDTPPRGRAGFAVSDALALLRDRRLVFFIAAAGIGQAAHAVYYTFATLDWQRLGYSDTVIGTLWATGVVAEIVLFAFGRRIGARFPPVTLAMLAVAAAALRWLAMSVGPPLAIVFVLQSLHAFSFGALHLATMSGLHRMVSPGLLATGQGIYAAVSGGITMALASAVAGVLYGAYGRAAYIFAAGLAIAALGMFALLRPAMADRPPSSPELG